MKSGTANGNGKMRVRLFDGIIDPQAFGPLGPREALLDTTTGIAYIELVDCPNGECWYKAFAGRPITVKGVEDKSKKWTGYLARKDNEGGRLYVRDMIPI